MLKSSTSTQSNLDLNWAKRFQLLDYLLLHHWMVATFIELVWLRLCHKHTSTPGYHGQTPSPLTLSLPPSVLHWAQDLGKFSHRLIWTTLISCQMYEWFPPSVLSSPLGSMHLYHPFYHYLPPIIPLLCLLSCVSVALQYRQPFTALLQEWKNSSL